MLGKELEATLHRSLATAKESKHEYATLEHLLLAMVDDPHVIPILRSCATDLDKLRNDTQEFLDEGLADLAGRGVHDPKPTAAFQRSVQRAAINVQSRGEDTVTGADILVALYSEETSHAVYLLAMNGATFDKVSNCFVACGASSAPARQTTRPRVFIVHGHDEAAREAAARVVERAGLEAIVLREQPGEGRTILERFEKHSAAADFAVVLLTPDDIGGPCGTSPDQLKPRARQNVIAELFFFIGLLGRNRVCALVKGDIELPSDLAGVVYKEMDPAGHWRLVLAQAMVSAGLPVDLNKVFRL
jgi:predicted nucleotide-binding protein